MKKIAVFVFACIIALNVIFLPVFKISGVDISEEEEGVTVLSLWHADTVPGGRNSRGGYLKAVAEDFGKKHKNVHIMVTVYPYGEMVKRLMAGDLPDLISFGNKSPEVLDFLQEYNGTVRFSPALEKSVTADSKIMAVPWSFGGYFQIGEGEKIAFSTEGFLSTEKVMPDGDHTELPSLDGCYNGYLSKGTPFVGTSRELSKITTSVRIGRLDPPAVTPLVGFSDLVNAVGISENTDKKGECEDFLAFLQSEGAQLKISSLNLFSAVGHSLYGNDSFGDYEKEYLKNADKVRFENLFRWENDK